MSLHWRLHEETIRLSVHKTFEEARKEWVLYNIYMEDDPDNYLTCVCGHHPIKEIIELINKHNDYRLIVGNCCIKKIMGENKDKFYNALKRGSVNEAVIEQGYKDEIINIGERDFMIGVYNKNALVSKQRDAYAKINKRLLDYYIKNSNKTTI